MSAATRGLGAPRIVVISPSPTGPRGGNATSARRYASLRRGSGARVVVRSTWAGEGYDLAMVLHARRSAATLRALKEKHPERPVILVMTGTDLYCDLPRNPAARRSIALADRLLVLQPLGVEVLPPEHRAKARVVIQSVSARMPPWDPVTRRFRVCVPGHLRPVKDPFRAAMASRRLGRESRIEVVQIGRAISPAMGRRAEEEMARNPRYRWMGEMSRSRLHRVMARSHLVLVTSVAEGGSNVVCESLAGGYPIATSAIDGSLGILGEDHPATFAPRDTAGLARLLHDHEAEPQRLDVLRRRSRELAPLVRPERERRALVSLLRELL